MLRDLGVTLIAADSPSSFLDDGLRRSWSGKYSARSPSSTRP
jgi:hypothetical protein